MEAAAEEAALRLLPTGVREVVAVNLLPPLPRRKELRVATPSLDLSMTRGR